ncbi:hypothetical protein DSO57_1025756 [Entomophthora muscae]|uniref:Uncharacterized protein n=1 Tax=Entomophthora muscae TaxID=34485 RepID=A0ACC2S467_9FUNG|nr:hypothetical protein DSO57_1025756 [Entomophthora muscae]
MKSAAVFSALLGGAQCLKVMMNVGISTLSHARPLLEMGEILRKRDHDVIYVSHDFAESFNKDYKFPFISLGNSSYEQQTPRSLFSKLYDLEETNPAKAAASFFEQVVPLAYEETYERINKVLYEEKPDVILCDWMAAACRDAAQMNAIPLITGFQSLDAAQVGAPFITDRNGYGSITTKPLSFFQRFEDKVLHTIGVFFYNLPLTRALNIARANYGVPPAALPFGDFSTSLGLSSSFIGVEPAAPLPPHIRLVGPVKSTTNPQLTSQLKFFLDAHPRTLYIGFGSDIVLSPSDIDNLVVSTLLSIKHGFLDGVIWGLGQTTHDDFPNKFNVNGTEVTRDQFFENPHTQLLTWAPQAAILEHKNTRLFVSHAGLESSIEAILSGTPILSIPFFGDQPRNARKLEEAGVSLYFARATTSSCTLAKGIKMMLADIQGQYHSNVKRMQRIAQLSSRRAVSGADAIEDYASIARICRPHHPYVYGEIPCELRHLTLASRNMNYFTANCFDVYAVAALICIALLLTFVYAMHGVATATSDKFKPEESKKTE